MRELVGVARNGLREVREAVADYRRPTLTTELATASRALSAAGIEMTVDQQVGALTGPVEAALAWTVREGVTNVVRHSGSRRCRVALASSVDGIRAEIVDDGRGEPHPRLGNGLAGLRERLGKVGGELEAGAAPGAGFRLCVTIPAAAMAEP
jgi:two-component system sensor histidine kinase DesK